MDNLTERLAALAGRYEGFAASLRFDGEEYDDPSDEVDDATADVYAEVARDIRRLLRPTTPQTDA